jgi:tRNA1(Val) A37 N6-methylase TrmN6
MLEKSEFDGVEPNHLVVDQPKAGYRYTLDPILLGFFIHLGRRERVIDFGSGVGVIGLVLASIFTDAVISGIEIQKELYEASLKNIQSNGLDNRVESQLGDFRRVGDYFRLSSFTTAVSNPPYHFADDGRVSQNSGVAIAKHEIAGGIKDVIEGSAVVLKKGGNLSTIFPANKYQYLTDLLIDGGFSIKRVRFVHSKKHLKSKAVMVESILGKVKISSQSPTIMEPLIVHNEDGGYTEEVNGFFRRIGAI